MNEEMPVTSRNVSLLAITFPLGIVLVSLAGFARAQDTPALPGGATTLKEVHGDWTVDCGLPTSPNATPKVSCTLSEQLLDNKTHKRVMAIALNPADGGGAKGTLVMPFGLALGSGVTLQLDEGTATAALPFHTCLPGGCLVAIDWSDKTVAGVRSAKKLILAAAADNGTRAPFNISLDGFGSALDRANSLMLTK